MRQRRPGACSDWEIISDKAGEPLVIRDLDRGNISVTNDAEHVVAELRKGNMLPPGRRLYYYDSADDLSEIQWNEEGFAGFAHVPGGGKYERAPSRRK